MEKRLLLVVLVAGCAVCADSLARDRVGSGSGIGGRHGMHSFGSDSLMPPRQPEPRRDRGAAAGGSAEKKEADKDPKAPEVKKITTAK